MNHPLTLRRVPGFESWSLPSRPFHFVYFVAEEDHIEHAVYHDHLVIAEVLLHRVMKAKARGIRPVNLRLQGDAEQYCFQRPRSGRGLGDSVENIRWVDRGGFGRARPLNREQLTQELMDRWGISLLRAIDLVLSESHALSGEDQAWLEQRACLPVLDRPLIGSEYLALVRAIEVAYAVPPEKSISEKSISEKSSPGKSGTEKSSACAANAAIALRTARALGWLHEDYTPSPFRIAALSMAYRMGHHDYLTRRAAFACAAGERLRFSHADPRVKIEAKLARHRTEHAALLAYGALAGAMLLDRRFQSPDVSAIERGRTVRA